MKSRFSLFAIAAVLIRVALGDGAAPSPLANEEKGAFILATDGSGPDASYPDQAHDIVKSFNSNLRDDNFLRGNNKNAMEFVEDKNGEDSMVRF
jgi:hypothetical protein